jgi:hypothetical protein
MTGAWLGNIDSVRDHNCHRWVRCQTNLAVEKKSHILSSGRTSGFPVAVYHVRPISAFLERLTWVYLIVAGILRYEDSSHREMLIVNAHFSL